MTLRRLLPQDAEAVAALHAGAYDAPWSAEGLVPLLADDRVVVIGLEDDGRLLGFVLARHAADEAEILMLAVDPTARRRGHARRLLDAASRELRAHGAARLFLEVAEDNAAACALYAAAGFRPCGRRRLYYARLQGRVDALVLSRSLDTQE